MQVGRSRCGSNGQESWVIKQTSTWWWGGQGAGGVLAVKWVLDAMLQNLLGMLQGLSLHLELNGFKMQAGRGSIGVGKGRVGRRGMEYGLKGAGSSGLGGAGVRRVL